MSDAPERIWARHVAHYGLDDLELGCWWNTPEYGDEVEYVRANLIEERDDIIRQGRERIEDLVSMVNSKDDRIEELEAKLTKAVEALTPSGDTKAAYIAEVETDCPCGRPHTVSWTATKDIMKMIRERAELKGGIGDE